MAKNLNESDAKLVQWLVEAHTKEAELEADLAAHISLTTKNSYRKRLQQHLTETRAHKKRVEQRIRAIGGSASVPSRAANVPGVPGAVGELAGKAVSAVKGQIGMARAIVTEQNETHLRNAQEEFREEHVEIAMYTRIEALATEVGDRETATLARGIRREEERMAKFLGAELKRLVKDVVRAEIPREQRATTRRRSSTGTRRTASTRRTAASATRASTGSRSTASRSSASRSTASRSTASRSASSRSGTSGSSGTRGSNSRRSS